ncbi:MAG: hypothetical protein M1823_003262 [Watsoniomyces obsoletus]|nr:MAG: hypothetical protein M1823_003262 [Watsoniomyces obsoletus]
MDDGDDDFYDLGDAVDIAPTTSSHELSGTVPTPLAGQGTGTVLPLTTMEGLEDGEDDDDADDSDDSDIDIITERKDVSKPEAPVPQSRHSVMRTAPARRVSATTTTATSAAPEASPSVKKELTPKTATPSRSGADYPEVRTSKIDVDKIPVYEPVGKLLTEVDIDADLKEHDKAWRLPGTDVSDYFNYGFDEFTWTLYCLKQEKTRAQAQEDKSQFANGMMMAADGAPLAIPGLPPMPPNGPPQGMSMPPVPGMPDMPPEMQALMAQMMASGMDPAQLAQMDPSMFNMPHPGPNQPGPGGHGGGPPPPGFQNGPPSFGPQGQNQPQMPYGFEGPMMGMDPSRNPPGNYGGGRGGGGGGGRGRGSGRRNW